MPSRSIVSRLTNPFHNLALETVLFKHKPQDQHLLFIYFNDPCIVIGRNQNPWAECNLNTALPILRRKSGGGAVVHDPNNANFCVQFPRAEFSRTKHLDMVVNAFPQLGLKINERNDLILNSRKVSGSSYKIEKNAAYHHATLLLNSDLSSFKGLLTPAPNVNIKKSGGTESVKSPVANTNLTKDAFIEAMVTEFTKLYGPSDMEFASQSWITDEVEKEADELRSWDWVFGKTPKFELELPNNKVVEVIKGCLGDEKLPRNISEIL